MDLRDCEDIALNLTRIFHGWELSVQDLQPSDPRQPRAVVSHRGGMWTWRKLGAAKPRDWDRIPPRSAIRVLTDIHDAAIHWYIADHPQFLCMHGAAAQIGQTLICFPARGFSGKSTLMASLARRGHKIFADDVLLLAARRNAGISLGFSPRLRTPLPEALSSSTRRYIEKHSGPASHGWAYMTPPAHQLAHLGEARPVGAVVHLHRQQECRARLQEIDTAAVLKPLIAENITRHHPMPEIFNRLHSLARKSRRYSLTFSDPDDAARLLTSHFT